MANIRREKRQEKRRARRAARRGETLREEKLTEEPEQEEDSAVSAESQDSDGTTEEAVKETAKQETKDNSEDGSFEKTDAEAAEETAGESEPEKPEEESGDVSDEEIEAGYKKKSTEEPEEKAVAGTAVGGGEEISRPEVSGRSSEGSGEENESALPIDGTVEAEGTGETSVEAGEEAAEEPEDGSAEEPEEDKAGFFRRLVRGLTKTRQNIVRGFDSIFSGHSAITDEFYEDLEEVLIMGDVGVHATEEILDKLREKVKENNIKDPADCREYLMNSIKEQMSIGETAYRFENEKAVILVIGVNGVGKTTTIGKLAGKFKKEGKKVVLAAADTFRAAAAEQLTEWAHRAGVDIVSGQEGSDPGSVVYDACQAARSRDADILICDTAGRLHNKKNLMAELEKIGRILTREYPDVYRETLVVLDATTGQNALNQAKQFNEVTDITGVVLTKMDGTAKGGIAVAIQSELGIPVKYIGVGETIDDLQKFDSDRFVDALFESGEEE